MKLKSAIYVHLPLCILSACHSAHYTVNGVNLQNSGPILYIHIFQYIQYRSAGILYHAVTLMQGGDWL